MLLVEFLPIKQESNRIYMVLSESFNKLARKQKHEFAKNTALHKQTLLIC